jgi:hypothetical protein
VVLSSDGAGRGLRVKLESLQGPIWLVSQRSAALKKRRKDTSSGRVKKRQKKLEDTEFEVTVRESKPVKRSTPPRN